MNAYSDVTWKYKTESQISYWQELSEDNEAHWAATIIRRMRSQAQK